MNKYWNITEILPYQRIFNFIVGPRSVGKTYSTQKWLLKQGIEKGRETVYITRTLQEQNQNGSIRAWEKVLQNEFSGVHYRLDKGVLLCDDIPVVRTLALTQAVKLKKISFPSVHYMMFDEYQLESGTGKYINDFMEPELFLMLYHTIDREEQRVKCFFLGNNTSYYNPYHMYKAFGLPDNPATLQPGKIWKNKVTLFEHVKVSDELLHDKESNPFLQALEGTRYGDYATEGKYIDDSYTNLGTRQDGARQIALFKAGGEVFGLYNNALACQLLFSDKIDPSCNWKVSLDKSDIKDGYTFFKDVAPPLKNLIKQMYKYGAVVYESMGVKAKIEPRLILMI